MTADRCPTCDREECPRPAAVAAYQGTTPLANPDDVLAAAIAMIDAEAACLAAATYGRESRRARRTKERAANKQAFAEMRADAARWRKVAPLIEALRAVDAEYHNAPASVAVKNGAGTRRLNAIAALLAAAQEPTP